MIVLNETAKMSKLTKLVDLRSVQKRVIVESGF